MRRLPVVVAALAVALLGGACGGGDSTSGADIYRENCATCHGADGQGGVGPTLAGQVADKYPDIADEISVVTNGRNLMPAWGSRLSEDEIRSVVTYTRTDLGT